MSDISTAVVGAGFMGPAHVEALRRLGIQVTGILGVDEMESQSAAKKLGLPRAYRNFREVLADPEVRAVHITTPNRLHFQMARDALKERKHVLCEKPLAMNSKETAHLLQLAKRTHCAAGVNRTGLAVGIYRLQNEHWTLEQVLAELRAHGFEDDSKHESVRQALAEEAAASHSRP